MLPKSVTAIVRCAALFAMALPAMAQVGNLQLSTNGVNFTSAVGNTLPQTQIVGVTFHWIGSAAQFERPLFFRVYRLVGCDDQLRYHSRQYHHHGQSLRPGGGHLYRPDRGRRQLHAVGYHHCHAYSFQFWRKQSPYR